MILRPCDCECVFRGLKREKRKRWIKSKGGGSKEGDMWKKPALNFLKVKRFSEEQLTDFLLERFSSSVKTEELVAAGEKKKKNIKLN